MEHVALGLVDGLHHTVWLGDGRVGGQWNSCRRKELGIIFIGLGGLNRNLWPFAAVARKAEGIQRDFCLCRKDHDFR